MSDEGGDTRSPGNRHYLNGKGHAFWKDKARGFEPRIVRRSGGEHHVLMKSGPDDELVKQSGGIDMPRDVKIRPDTLLFRFYSSKMDQILGKGGWIGNWWIEEGVARVLFDRARERGKRLSTVAMDHLLIPRHWNNCSHVVKARVVTTCRAFGGPGIPVRPDPVETEAPRGTEPPRHLPRSGRKVDAPERTDRLHANTPSDSVDQLYIPGPCTRDDPPEEVARFRRMFRILGQGRCDDLPDTFFQATPKIFENRKLLSEQDLRYRGYR